MNILQKLLYQDLPKDFLFSYGKYICRRKRLNNGWFAVRLSNKMLFLLHKKYTTISVPACKKVTESVDGKMMVKDRLGNIVVYSVSGEQMTSFNQQAFLYPNGWFKGVKKGILSLYNTQGDCVGSHLRYAKVYKNGMYHISVDLKKGNARCAGIFSADGEKLCPTNSKKAYVFPNGWFVTMNMLFDNLGNIYIAPIPERRVPNWLLCLIGYFMKTKKA